MKQRKEDMEELEEDIEEDGLEEPEEEIAQQPQKTRQPEQKKWGVSLAVVDERTLPQKVVVNTKTGESLDLHMAIAELLNNQEKLKKLLD